MQEEHTDARCTFCEVRRTATKVDSGPATEGRERSRESVVGKRNKLGKKRKEENRKTTLDSNKASHQDLSMFVTPGQGDATILKGVFLFRSDFHLSPVFFQ